MHHHELTVVVYLMRPAESGQYCTVVSPTAARLLGETGSFIECR